MPPPIGKKTTCIKFSVRRIARLNVCFLQFITDLGNLDTVKPLAEEVEKTVGNQGLNILINNAGSNDTSF